MLQTILDGTQVAADTGNVVDSVLDGLYGSGSAGLRADINAINPHGLGVHIADGDFHLVEGIAGIADLQG